MIDVLRELIGQAPAGLEFMEYMFQYGLVLLGSVLLYKMITAITGIMGR